MPFLITLSPGLSILAIFWASDTFSPFLGDFDVFMRREGTSWPSGCVIMDSVVSLRFFFWAKVFSTMVNVPRTSSVGTSMPSKAPRTSPPSASASSASSLSSLGSSVLGSVSESLFFLLLDKRKTAVKRTAITLQLTSRKFSCKSNIFPSTKRALPNFTEQATGPRATAP